MNNLPKGIRKMSEHRKKTPKRVIAVRIICGLLALLMMSGVAYSAILFLIS